MLDVHGMTSCIQKELRLTQATLCLVKLTYLQVENIQRKYGIQYLSTRRGLYLLVAPCPCLACLVSCWILPNANS